MIFKRYLRREFVFTLLLIIIIFVSLATVIMLIQYLTKAASGSILGKLVWLILLSNIPSFLLITLPIAVFLSILIVFGRMFHDSELLVAFTCGFNWLNMLRVCIVPTFVIALFMSFLSFYIVPKMNGYRGTLLSQELTGSDLSYVNPETFTHLGSSDTWIYASKYKDGFLHNVFLFTNKASQQQLVFAKSASEVKKDGDSKLMFSDGSQYILPKSQDSGLRVIDFAQFSTDMSTPKSKIDNSLKFLSINKLIDMGFKKVVVVEILKRLAQPLNVIIMAFLGLMLCVVNRGQGRYGKIFFGVLVYIIYFNLTAILINWADLGYINDFVGIFIIQILISFCFLFWILKKQGVKFIKNKGLNGED